MTAPLPGMPLQLGDRGVFVCGPADIAPWEQVPARPRPGPVRAAAAASRVAGARAVPGVRAAVLRQSRRPELVDHRVPSRPVVRLSHRSGTHTQPTRKDYYAQPTGHSCAIRHTGHTP